MEIAAGSLLGHLMTRHGKAAPRRHLWAPQTTGGPRTYQINFPGGSRRQCPVEGCPGVSETRAAMRVQFVHRHVHDTVVGVGPGARRLLRNYWRRLTMAARSGGYYGTCFKEERGVTQGDPLSPTLFNVVVDAVVRQSPLSIRSVIRQA